MIDPDVGLILIVGFDGRPLVIVRGTGGGRLRYRWSSESATGSMRSDGIALPGNGVRVNPLPLGVVVAGS